ncbi:MAG: threonine aldolase family protein [Bacilli bacterium]
MYTFSSDYNCGAHPLILRALVKNNLERLPGYGEDKYSESASTLIKNIINNNDATIHFVSGGTQANLTLIKAALRPFEAVISCDTGHIYVHECGAIEATGHKVIPIVNQDGKLSANDIIKVINEHQDSHMVVPKLIYISNTTELGSIYTKAEIIALSKVARSNNMFLFIDGARLGNALAASNNDLTFEDLGLYCDAFTIGGTKNGALFGEAIIINNPIIAKDFNYIVKQTGALFAKGSLIAIQFCEFFNNDLYLKLASHANEMAMKVRDVFVSNGYTMASNSQTNQQFVLVNQQQYEYLIKEYQVADFTQNDEIYILRFMCSWATKKEDIINLSKYISEGMKI